MENQEAMWRGVSVVSGKISDMLQCMSSHSWRRPLWSLSVGFAHLFIAIVLLRLRAHTTSIGLVGAPGHAMTGVITTSKTACYDRILDVLLFPWLQYGPATVSNFPVFRYIPDGVWIASFVINSLLWGVVIVYSAAALKRCFGERPKES
ncbi:MAG TPA: hypothetical protein VG733_17910 [Chthoniobacteraceae bacterium]|nr:hypothetical protein [Chthoniobacteraceae bacterium]